MRILIAEDDQVLADGLMRTLMAQLENNHLQRISDIEQYVRQTQLYRSHCYNFQDLPTLA